MDRRRLITITFDRHSLVQVLELAEAQADSLGLDPQNDKYVGLARKAIRHVQERLAYAYDPELSAK